MSYQQQNIELEDGSVLNIRVSDCLMICQLGNKASLQGVFLEEEKAFLIGDVFVEPPFRRTGIASVLLQSAETIAAQSGMESLRGNLTKEQLTDAPYFVSFLQKQGFELVKPFAEFAQRGIEKQLSSDDTGA